MTALDTAAATMWADAVLAAALFAINPAGSGGIAVRAPAGPVRERWVTVLRSTLPPSVPVLRMPINVTDGRLLGGLDLAATLTVGRPVAERGLLSEANGGVVVIPSAERLTAASEARLCAAFDQGEVALERDGLTLRTAARFGVIAFDEGINPDERLPPALQDRLAFQLDLSALSHRDAIEQAMASDDAAAARALLPSVETSGSAIEALCSAAVALGIASVRAPMLALRVACANAALSGRSVVAEEDVVLAGRLVLAPRATRLPVSEAEPDAPDQPPPPHEEVDGETRTEETADQDLPLEDIVLAAAAAAIPAGLLAQLRLAQAGRARERTAGRAGALQKSAKRGRPTGARRGEPRSGVRLNVVETLRAAAPWQRLRREEALSISQSRPADCSERQPQSAKRNRVEFRRVEVRRDDFRVTRFKSRSETTTIFAVDASGSAALHRLAEAKGAVELLLADCYVRRDSVALLAFRGKTAELLLPPTRSLVRAKRSLAELPGGGGTPIAAGLEACLALADAVRRKGQTPSIVVLTDGRANVARDPAAGRAQAEDDALVMARILRTAGFSTLLVDTSPRPEPQAERLAAEMGAIYLPLPHAGAEAVVRAVKAIG